VNRADADALLFGDVLACEEARSAAFVPGVVNPATAHADSLQAETFLLAIAVVEDGRGEDPEEHGPTTLALNRIESKLDLLTTLVGALLRSRDADPVRPIRWSALGARITGVDVLPEGTTGHFRIQPSDWLPQALRLPAVVLAHDGTGADSALWLRFDALSPGLETALERHLFRVHRREIAERRRPR
jgi:hypothetical protein